MRKSEEKSENYETIKQLIVAALLLVIFLGITYYAFSFLSEWNQKDICQQWSDYGYETRIHEGECQVLSNSGVWYYFGDISYSVNDDRIVEGR